MRKMLVLALMCSSAMAFAGPYSQNSSTAVQKNNPQNSTKENSSAAGKQDAQNSTYSKLSKYLNRNNSRVAANNNPVFTDNHNKTMAIKTEDDRNLYEKIRNVLHQDSLSNGFETKKYDSIQLSVTDGNVVLQGHVETKAEKMAIEKRVQNIPGVVSVDNQLVVTGEHFWNSKDSDPKQDRD